MGICESKSDKPYSKIDEGFDPKVKSDKIVICGLNNYNLKDSYGYYNDYRMKLEKKEANPNKPEKEIEAEVKEEIKRNTNKLKEESMKRDYKINNEKAKELESIFNQAKLKINFDSEPKILRNGKFYTISKGSLFIYDNSSFNKLYEIKLEKESTNFSDTQLDNKDLILELKLLKDFKNFKNFSVIQLDNQDLILLSGDELIIYRLINGKFVLVQKINDNQAGYQTQMKHSGCIPYPKTYRAKFIKEISENRFILVSNYGYKIYSLNQKNEYTITLLEEYHDGLQTIIELDKNNFIFLSEIEVGASLGGPEHNILVIDKIRLKEISNSEKIEKLKKLNYFYLIQL